MVNSTQYVVYGITDSIVYGIWYVIRGIWYRAYIYIYMVYGIYLGLEVIPISLLWSIVCYDDTWTTKSM